MATIRLVPSTYYLSSSQYLAVSNASNMYNNTDNTTHATVTNSRSSTTSYYIYLRGFNFNDIPSGATINSFTVKLKANESGVSTSTSYKPYLANGTNTINGSCDVITTSVTVHSFTGIAADWETISGYGSDFGIRINCRRASSGTTSYMYIYGAEIEVDYTVPDPRTVTSVLVSGDGTIDPLGTTNTYKDAEYTLTITPTNKDDEVLITRDGVDVSNDLVVHGSEQSTTLTASSHTTSGIQSGSSYAAYCIGHSAENPYSSSNNMYASSGSTGYASYSFDFSDIPSNAIIEGVEVRAYGHRESATIDSSHVSQCVLYRGNTAISDEVNFPSTSNSMITITPNNVPTRSELDNVTLRHYVGYYGGLVLGISFDVSYSTGTGIDHYTYTFTVVNNTVLEVTIGAETPYIPPEEDPTKTYYSLTISSINADTVPIHGTERVEAGITQVVTISPTESRLTLALDNGVDISDQLQGGTPTNTYTVDTQVSGASYGFNLNNSTGYYVSTNGRVGSSASVARVNFDLQSDVLVTIQYINQGESQADYGMFGKIDTTVSTTGNTYASSSASPDDPSNYYYMCATAADSSTTVKTLTYEIPMGEHYIDIKYAKDQASDSGNDSLQWKILSIEATSAGGDYTYTLTNISQKHSLIFVFGDVQYYFITSTGTGCRLFPDGQLVYLPGDNYKLNIVPNNISAAVTATDNGTSVTSSLERLDGEDKQGNPAVSYTYKLSNISAAHSIIVQVGDSSINIYIKESGSWVPYSRVYKKVNGSWVEQDSSTWDTLFSTTANYVKGD